jgi:PKD repeat protein
VGVDEVELGLQPGNSCLAPYVTGTSSWTIFGGNYSVDYYQTQTNPVGYNVIHVTFLSAGTFTINTYYSCSSGTSGVSNSVTITVYDVTVPSITIAANNNIICGSSGSVSFTSSTANGGSNNNYDWYVNNNKIYSGPNSTFTANGLVNFDKVHAVFTSDKLCARPPSTSSNYITINTIQPPPATVSISTLKRVVNVGEPILVKAVVSGAGPNPIIQWFINGTPAPASTSSDPLIWSSNSWPYPGTRYISCKVIPQQIPCVNPSYSNSLTIDDCSKVNGVTLAITDATQFLCAIKFAAPVPKFTNCTTTYSWNFGDGTTSNDPSPMHAYPASGTYNVSLTVNYSCTICAKTLTATRTVTYTAPSTWTASQTVNVPTDQRPQVLSTAASTYSDSWPLSQPDNTLDARSSFIMGAQGIWRNNGAHVYKKVRQLSSTTDISQDGTFTLDQFNWQYADIGADPNWIKADNMTRYSPYSFELESKDVLDVYSGAIYDYAGQLPIANGVNMRNDEMAFTSFEAFAGNVTPGNWTLTAGSIPAYYYYKVSSGDRYMAIVEATQAQLAGIVNVDVSTDKPYASGTGRSTYTQGNQIVCMQGDPNSTTQSIVLRNAPSDGLWSGMLRIKNTANPNINPSYDVTVAHSGKRSLKVTTASPYTGVKQEQLRLLPGKNYFVSGWVSVGTNPLTPNLGSSLGMTVTARANSGTSIQVFPIFAPTGPVIEGWQQFQGTFLFPSTASYVDVTFGPGSGGAWYDDIRLQPESGNMKAYVYDTDNFRLQAILDEENFASYFYYDKEGSLYLTKKETKDGIKTITENLSYQKEQP